MKKSILASLLLTSSFCFANEVVLASEIVNATSPASAIQEKGFLEDSLIRNKVELGGYHIKDSDFKFAAKIETHLISDQFNRLTSLNMIEEYTIGDGISRADLLISTRGVGVNLGYIDLHHKNLDGGYIGIGAVHQFENGVELNGSYSPLASSDLKFLLEAGISIPLPIFRDSSLNINYAILGDKRKEKTENIIYSGNSLVASTIVEGKKDAKNTEMLSVFIKIPL